MRSLSRFRFVGLIGVLIALCIAPAYTAFAQEDAPPQIQSALDNLSLQTETALTLEDLTSYTYEMYQFGDASLDCPVPDQTYAQVITPGYQFDLVYNGIRYDYRVSEDQSIIILCSQEPVPVEENPPLPTAEPQRFVMNQPAVAIAPLGGVTGTPVTLIANGFPPNSLVLIGVGQVESEYDVLQTQQTSVYGALATTVTIPDYITSNQQVVFVVETNDHSLRVVSPMFVVSDASGGNTGSPTVTLQPLSGPPGTDIQLTATGFPPNTSVILGIGLQNTEGFNYSLRETTDAQGTLVTDVAIPQDALVNRPYIALVQVENNRDYEAVSAPFIPTGTDPTPIPDGNEFTNADIYLIATGDNGQTGIPVGCSDSAIPVQVNFDPTITPLTAALEQLLILGTQTYGQSGLYNALYQSDLAIEGINIVDRVATINLAGTLQVGGVCDTPRIEAQIAQTALQFGTVDSVNILINGQPFADATGG